MERINFRDRIVGNVKKNTLCPLYMASLNFSVYYDLWTSKRLSILCGVVACGTSYLCVIGSVAENTTEQVN
jgi:hypothetical protein